MFRSTTLITLVLTLTAMSTSFATILPTEPQISGEIQQSMNFEGFNASLYAANEAAWLHEWTDEETGETYSHVHAQQSSGSFGFRLDQGFMGYYYIPAPTNTRINRWDDEGRFYIESTFSLLLIDEVQEWANPPYANMGWDFGGIHYNIGTELHHKESWDKEFQTYIQTNNIEGNVGFSFRDSLLNYASFYIREDQEWYNGAWVPSMEIRASFGLEYIGTQQELQTFNAMIPLSAVPEPATLVMLGIGAALALKRRK